MSLDLIVLQLREKGNSSKGPPRGGLRWPAPQGLLRRADAWLPLRGWIWTCDQAEAHAVTAVDG
ncbi:MAG: hypothetical protein AAFX85_18800, partial [Pseudomonadota bacterium]